MYAQDLMHTNFYEGPRPVVTPLSVSSWTTAWQGWYVQADKSLQPLGETVGSSASIDAAYLQRDGDCQ